jgi:hypothetical protein
MRIAGRTYTFGQLRKATINLVGLVLLGATFALDKAANLPGWATTALGGVVVVGTVITHFSTANDAVLTEATNVLDSTPLTAAAAQALVRQPVGTHLDQLLSGAPTVLAAETATPVTAPITPVPPVEAAPATPLAGPTGHPDLQAAMDAALAGTGPQNPVAADATAAMTAAEHVAWLQSLQPDPAAAPTPAPRPVMSSATVMPAGALPVAPASTVG